MRINEQQAAALGIGEKPASVHRGFRGMKAHGKARPRGTMNRLEAKYAEHLEQQKRQGVIAWFMFEGVTLILTHGVKGGAKGSRYTADFFVMLADGTLEVHDVKGFAESRQINALKFAAETYPFRFIMAEKVAEKRGGGWKFTDF